MPKKSGKKPHSEPPSCFDTYFNILPQRECAAKSFQLQSYLIVLRKKMQNLMKKRAQPPPRLKGSKEQLLRSSLLPVPHHIAQMERMP